MEKLLREYAQQRRASFGPPMELHPADRRLLQGEVIRRRRGGAGSWLRSFVQSLGNKPVWVAGGATVITLAVVTSMALLGTGRDRRQTMTETKSLAVRESVQEPTPLPAVVPHEAPAAADSSTQLASVPPAAAQETRKPALLRRYGLAPSAVPSAKNDNTLNDTGVAGTQPGKPLEGVAGRGVTLSDRMALAATSEAIPAAETTAPSVPIQSVSGFSETAPATDSATTGKGVGSTRDQMTGTGAYSFGVALRDTAPAVLKSFLVEPMGRQLRIVDNDGSVYLGEWENPEPTQDAPAARRALGGRAAGGGGSLAKKVKAEVLAPPDAGRRFRVEGTNVTLGQRVLFTGSLVGLTNNLRFVTIPQPAATRVSAPKALSGGAPATSATPAVIRITGKVVVGVSPQTSETQIQAVPIGK